MLQLTAFVLSLSLELPVTFAVVRWRSGGKVAGRALLASALGTGLSHPSLWWAQHRLPSTVGVEFVLELVVVAFEALMLMAFAQLRPQVALAASFSANATSWLLGGWVLAWVIVQAPGVFR